MAKKFLLTKSNIASLLIINSRNLQNRGGGRGFCRLRSFLNKGGFPVMAETTRKLAVSTR